VLLCEAPSLRSTKARRPTAVFLAVCGSAFLADQLVKALVLRVLPTGPPVRVLGWATLSVIHNRASAFGLVESPWVLIGLGALVSAAIVAYSFAYVLRARPELSPPLALILGGSLGNLLDRLRTGAVTDFVDVHVWPVFNVADAAITLGAVWLVARLLLSRRKATGAK
jgi:signal peptidase II